MKPKINRKQLLSIFNLMSNLKEIQEKGLASIKDIVAMTNPNAADTIFLCYEKYYSNGGDSVYEYKIAQIDTNGMISFIDDKFRNIFERYSFLGECKTFDIENKDEFEQID